jgi:hypothetical protein
MSICIVVQPQSMPAPFLDYLRRFMTRYYEAVEIRQGDRDDIVLEQDASPADLTRAWMLYDSAGADYCASLREGSLATTIEKPMWRCI